MAGNGNKDATLCAFGVQNARCVMKIVGEVMEMSSDDQVVAEALWRSPAILKRAYADYRYGQLHYRIGRPAVSDKLPLVLFHQTGSSGRCYENFTAEMARDRTALVVDSPSSGTSDPLPRAPFIEDFADAMEDLLDGLKLGPVDLMGDHTGAFVAVELAKRRSQQVRRVVLNAAPIFLEGETAVRTYPRKPDLDGNHILARWRRVLGFLAPTSITLGELEFIEGLRPGPFTYHGPHAVFSYPLGDNIPKVTQPLLILRAKDDLWEQTARARPLIATGEMIDLPQYGREMLMAHYREVAVLVRRFLDT